MLKEAITHTGIEILLKKFEGLLGKGYNYIQKTASNPLR